MRCPFCGAIDTQVKDSRSSEDGAAIRRRRVCPECGGRFTTFERIQLRDLTVSKKSGRKEVFSREKLARSLQIALRKRPIPSEQQERLVQGIIRQLESLGETEIDSIRIGMQVMEALRQVDTIAFIRFASVYKDFQEMNDFEAIMTELRPEAIMTELRPEAIVSDV